MLFLGSKRQLLNLEYIVKIFPSLSHDNDLIEPQTTFATDKRPVKVSCGGNHSALLLCDGSLFVTGDNSQGQCGLPNDNQDVVVGWKQVPGTYRDVACGWEYTVVISTDQRVMSCGWGPKGELGQGSTKKCQSLELVMETSSTARIYSSFQNCYLVDGQKIFGWGPNRRCQLNSSKSKGFDVPVLIYDGERVDHFCTGRDFVCFSSGQKLHINGSLNTQLTKMSYDVENKDVLKLAGMWSSLHIWIPDRVLSYGNGSHGQLLTDELPPGVTQLVTGSEHGILCLNDKRVVCWGWGEHGNCGRLPNSSSKSEINDCSNTVSPLNVVYECHDERVEWCYGGCASTWICLNRLS